MTAQNKAASPWQGQQAAEDNTDNANLNGPGPVAQDALLGWFALGDRARMAAKQKRQRASRDRGQL